MNTRVNDNTVELSDNREETIWSMYNQIQKDEQEQLEAERELDMELQYREFEKMDTQVDINVDFSMFERHDSQEFINWLMKHQEVVNKAEVFKHHSEE